MSGVSGAGRSDQQRIDAFEDKLIYDQGPGGVGATFSDSERGKTITKREMAKAVPVLTQGGPLKAKSRNEVWSTMERLLLTDGAKDVLKAAIGPAPAAPALPGTPSGKLAKDLEKMMKGLVYISEGDYPYKAFHAPLDKSKPFDAAHFKALAGLPASRKISMQSAADFFKQNQDPQYGSDAADIAKYKALEAAMKADLKDIKLIYGGPEDMVEAPVYVVGRAKDGSLVGLSSTRIWT